MNIREATTDDLSDILRMGVDFFQAASSCHNIECDTLSIIQTAEELIDSPNGCLIVAEQDGDLVGMVAGVLYPFHFNRAITVCQEILWWVDPDRRGERVGPGLFKALESWANQNGASYMIMASQPNLVDSDKAERFFAKHEYVKADQNFMRSLDRRH